MSMTDQLGALEYEAENPANWAENVNTFATHRPAILDPIDTKGFTQDGIDPERVVMQLQGGTPPIKGPKGCTFKTDFWLAGHGSTTSGATSLDPMETLKGYAWGNPASGSGVIVSAANGTTAAAGSTTTSVNTVASGTIARGSLVRLGTSGLSADARGAGQWYAVNNHTGTVLTLRHATLTALNAADVIYSAANFWIPETLANTAVGGLRFRWITGNQAYRMHGCFPTQLALTGLSPAETPRMSVTWGATWWDSTSGVSLPSAVSQNQYNPAPIGGGSLIIGDVGSTTRTAYDCRAFSVTVQLGMVPLPGHAGVDPYSRYKGARRVPSKIRFSVTFDAEATGTHIWEDKFNAGTSIWMTNSLSTAAGTALGLHMQNCRIDKRPVQSSMNGINSVTLEGYANAGPDVATDLSQAALVVAYG
jgi:hypothetical protein